MTWLIESYCSYRHARDLEALATVTNVNVRLTATVIKRPFSPGVQVHWLGNCHTHDLRWSVLTELSESRVLPTSPNCWIALSQGKYRNSAAKHIPFPAHGFCLKICRIGAFLPAPEPPLYFCDFFCNSAVVLRLEVWTFSITFYGLPGQRSPVRDSKSSDRITSHIHTCFRRSSSKMVVNMKIATDWCNWIASSLVLLSLTSTSCGF
jgi:hypothetical protein